MSDNWHRVLGVCGALAVLWIIVYWWWQPSEPRIRFDAEPKETRGPAEDMPATEAAPVAPAQEPPVAVIPPRFREYTVQRGDTLEGIARRELGSPRYVEAISRANPFANLDPLRPGRVINIPVDPDNIQGAAVGDGLRGPDPAEVEGGMVEYTVRPGDTLTRIARHHYGSIRYADLIYEANRDRLTSRHALQVGQVLRLPPTEESGR